jgi:hypothetical protein
MTSFESFLCATETYVDARETFGGFAAEGRQLTGMSLRQAAIEFRTAAGTISRWENGHSAPPAISRREIIVFYRTRVRKIRDASASKTQPYASSANSRPPEPVVPMAAMGPHSR